MTDKWFPQFMHQDSMDIDGERPYPFDKFLDDVRENVAREMIRVLIIVLQLKKIEVNPENVQDVVRENDDFMFSFEYTPVSSFKIKCIGASEMILPEEYADAEVDEGSEVYELISEQVHGWCVIFDSTDKYCCYEDKDEPEIEMVHHFYNCLIYKSSGNMYVETHIDFQNIYGWNFGPYQGDTGDEE